LRTIWSQLSLAKQFALLASVLIGIAMAIIGNWVSDEIEDSVLQKIAASRAVYLESYLAPYSQDLAVGPDIRQEHQDRISLLLSETAFWREKVSIKIWAPGGRIAYSTNPTLINKVFPVLPRLARAFAGEVSAHIEKPKDEENEYESKLGRALFEIYAPVRERDTDRIIAVVELYEVADQFKAEMRQASRRSWLIVGFITLGMIATLYTIVHRGSRTILRQREELAAKSHALSERVKELSRLLAQNQDLQSRIQIANSNAASNNEQFLRRVGADLHDGPAQLIGLALLQLERVNEKYAHADVDEVAFIRMRNALTDAMAEIRILSAGIAPPELANVTPAEAIKLAVRAHERRTGTSVRCDVGALPRELPAPVKVCLYRFAQEGLNNASRHADGLGQAVRAGRRDTEFFLEVSDSGPGIPEPDRLRPGSLGLSGLRCRVEALGGSFELNADPSVGTRLVARFEVSERELAHA
jgi:signal transduction histidine kinase